MARGGFAQDNTCTDIWALGANCTRQRYVHAEEVGNRNTTIATRDSDCLCPQTVKARKSCSEFTPQNCKGKIQAAFQPGTWAGSVRGRWSMCRAECDVSNLSIDPMVRFGAPARYYQPDYKRFWNTRIV